MPYSPRWLVHHDRESEARKVLATLRGLPQDHELVELEFLEIKAQSTFEKRTVADKFPHLQSPSAWNTFKLQFVAIGSLFKSMAMFRRVIVATVTMYEFTILHSTQASADLVIGSFNSGLESMQFSTTLRRSSPTWVCPATRCLC